MKILRATSIIEVVIAAALISVAIIAALSLSNSSQRQNSYARDLAEANKYATQLADWVRSQRDQVGYATLAAKNQNDTSSYCLNTLPSTFSLLGSPGSCDPNSFITGTQFQRVLTVDNTVSGKVKATITVSWQDSNTRTAQIEMELTQW